MTAEQNTGNLSHGEQGVASQELWEGCHHIDLILTPGGVVAVKEGGQKPDVLVWTPE